MPGPFYYYLIGLPLYLFGSVVAVLWFQYFLCAVGAIALWFYLRKKESLFSACLFLLLFLNSYQISFQLQSFWNPSFLILPILLLLMIFYREPEPKYVIIAGLILGLGVQIHYSILIFLFPILISLILNKRIREMFLFLAMFFIPLLPYLVFRYSSQTANSDILIAGGATRLLTVFTHIFYNAADLFNLSLIISASKLFFSEQAFLPTLLVLISFRKRIFAKFKFLGLSFIFSLPILALLIFGIYLLRYSMGFFLMLAFLSSVFLPQFNLSNKKILFPLIFAILLTFFGLNWNMISTRLYFGPMFFIFLLVGFLFIRNAFDYFYEKLLMATFYLTLLVNISLGVVLPQSTSEMLPGENLKNVLREISSRTSWDYTFLREHTYRIGFSQEDDWSLSYQLLRSQTPPLPRHDTYDGLIVGLNLSFDQLLDKVPTQIRSAFSRGEVKCVTQLQIDSIGICLYRFSPNQEKLRWNNMGYAYQYAYVPDFKIVSDVGYVKTSDSELIFYMNKCQVKEDPCTVIFKLNFAGSLLRVEIRGDPLAMANVEQNPFWSLQLIKPTLNFTCGNKKVSIELIETIGFGFMHISPVRAPFDGTYPLPCERPSAVSLSLEDGRSVFLGQSNFRSIDQFRPETISWP